MRAILGLLCASVLALAGCTDDGPKGWYVVRVEATGGGQWDSDAKATVVAGPLELETACMNARDRLRAHDPWNVYAFDCQAMTAAHAATYR